MALPTGVQLSFLDVWVENHGDGTSPVSRVVVDDQHAVAWQFTSTGQDNASEFEGKGRPEGITDPASAVEATSAFLNGDFITGGGYSEINCDWRFRWRVLGGSNNFTTIGTEDGTYTAGVFYQITGLSPQTTYEFELQLRNIHDNNNWQTENTETFLTPPPTPSLTSVVHTDQGSFQQYDLTWDFSVAPTGTPDYEYRYSDDGGSTWSSPGLINNVSGSGTGPYTGDVSITGGDATRDFQVRVNDNGNISNWSNALSDV